MKNDDIYYLHANEFDAKHGITDDKVYEVAKVLEAWGMKAGNVPAARAALRKFFEKEE